MDKKSTITQQDILEQMRNITQDNYTPECKALFNATIDAMSLDDAEAFLESLPEGCAAASDIELWVDCKEFKERDKDYESTKNLPVNDLLAMYKDPDKEKDSFVICDLLNRFIYLAHDEQIAIMQTFLPTVGGWYRERCYRHLHTWWDDAVKDIVISLWNKYHEAECGSVMISNLNSEELRPYVKELSNSANYHQLCRKCVNEPWFEVDMELMEKYCTQSEKLEIKSMTPAGITHEEALKWLYRVISDEILMYNDDTRDLYESARTTFDRSKKTFYMHRHSQMYDPLAQLCRLGHYDAVMQFLSYETRVCNRFAEENEALVTEAAEILSFNRGCRNTPSRGTALIYKEFLCYFARRFPAPCHHFADAFLKENNLTRVDDNVKLDEEELTPEVKGFISEFKGTIDYILEDTDKHILDEEDYSFIDLPF